VPTIHAETRLIEIEVSVTDSRGKPVASLTKEDFTIVDDGKPRTFDIFSVNHVKDRGAGHNEPATPTSPISTSAPPRSLPAATFSNIKSGPPAMPGHTSVIVLDAVHGDFINFQWARQAVIGVLQKVKPDERIALYAVSYGQGLVLLQDYTTNHGLLLTSMSRYIKRPKPPPGVTPEERDYVERMSVENVRLSLQGLADHLSLAPGRKNVFLLSTGFNAKGMRDMEKLAWEKTLRALNEANVQVDTVDPVGVMMNRAGGLFAEQEIADAPGGHSYFGRNDADQMLAEAIEASRTTYTLAFYLADGERDDKYHALTVKVARPGLQASYRQGYYAGDTEVPAADIEKTSQGDLSSSLLNQVDSSEVSFNARVDAVPGNPRGTVSVRVSLDSATLSLKEHGSGGTVKVEEEFLEVDARGNTLAKASDTKQFEVTIENRAQYENEGLDWPFSMPLIQGASKIMIVLRDANTGKVGSLSVPLRTISDDSPVAGQQAH